MSKEFLEAFAAGASGGLAIVAAIIWLFRDKFYNAVEESFKIRKNTLYDACEDFLDARKDAVIRRIQEWFKATIDEREGWYEAIRRNAHSITGLDKIMINHEASLTALNKLPAVLERQTEILENIQHVMDKTASEVARHTLELAIIASRSKNVRSDDR